MKIKVTIVSILEENLSNWEDAKDEEDMLQKIKDYTKNDASYFFEEMDGTETITIERIPDESL